MSSSVSGLSSSNSSLFTPIALNGVSQYSSDLQSVLNRAVQIAQIPIQELQNQDSNVQQKQNMLGVFQTDVSALANSLQFLGKLAGGQALSASSSDPSAVAAINTGSTSPANYVINSITAPASAANETSLTSYADSNSTPVSPTGTMELLVGSTPYTFTLANNNLTSLRDEINSLGAGVTASILTTSAGNYLSVAANATGATTLQLIDDPNGAKAQWLTHNNQGSDAQFQLDGINLQQPSNVVNDVIPGLTFTIQGTTNTPVTLSLQSDPTQLSSALQNFVTAYNQVQTDLKTQQGPSGGLLSGDTLITELRNSMQQIASYTSSKGSVESLADLGVEFDSSGTASFNQTTFSQLSDSQLSGAFSFIGSATAGLGGFSQALQQYSDPITGLIKTEQNGLSTSDKHIQSQITSITDRINTMQKNLASQLQKADTLLAELQNQQQTLTASLQGLSLVLYGRYRTQ
ncbi:MAG: flagellar filament capping protein FliD [Bryobacterales bacterium]|nr:flagellar filament capping protein FliD [Bryobacterales bacterium]MBV9401602.1 flagellar filament capping protein FliD [Bryobacterales bacterium]